MTQASNIVGERIISQLVKVPPGGWSSDGETIDAGTWAIAASNTNHLLYESVRHIGHGWRLGKLGVDTGIAIVARGSGYAGVIGATQPPTASINDLNRISWATEPGPNALWGGVARCYPMLLIADAKAEVGLRPSFRWIRAMVRAKSNSTNSLKLACAITPWDASPLQGNIWAPNPGEAFWQTVGTSEETKIFQLRPKFGVAGDFPKYLFRCELQGPNPVQVYVYAGRFWFGWYSTDPDDYWRTISIFECREQIT